MAENSEDSPFVGAMQFLGGVAGFLWGGYIAGQSPELELWRGLIAGAIVGAAAGWLAGKTLEAALQLAFIVLMLGLIVLRILQVVGFIENLAS